MKWFVSEYLCGGACSEDSGPEIDALLTEGRAMLLAVIRDLQHIPNVFISTTWDARLGDFPIAGVHVETIKSAEQEQQAFGQLAKRADWSIIIAPEFDRLLEQRCRNVENAGGRVFGPDIETIQICSDKLEMASRLKGHVPCIPTYEPDDPEIQQLLTESATIDLVMKPRFGAGSINIKHITSRQLFDQHRSSCSMPMIVQPKIPGRTLSVGVVIIPLTGEIDLLPVAEQHLSNDGTFKYQGGTIPTNLELNVSEMNALRSIVLELQEQLPGLTGYFGIDLLFDPASKQWTVVEINPRITSSFIGYSHCSTKGVIRSAFELSLSCGANHPEAWDFSSGPYSFKP